MPKALTEIEEMLYDFEGTEFGPEYLVLKKGMRLQRLEISEEWAKGRVLSTGEEGWYPPAYAQALPGPSGAVCAPPPARTFQ